MKLDLHTHTTFSDGDLEISGNELNELHPQNIKSVLVKLLVNIY